MSADTSLVDDRAEEPAASPAQHPDAPRTRGADDPATGVPLFGVAALGGPRDGSPEATRHAARGVPAVLPAGAVYTPFLPLLLLSLAVIGWTGFQTYVLVRERGQLATARAAQQPQVDAATRIRANLDALAAATQRLANAGNANARTVVDALRQRGVIINPNPTSVAPAARE